jgi:hypothetical protein|tara:strand:- start:431 stop:673 length:243 start_codon:yes stop_codon:yes gene_type:complete
MDNLKYWNNPGWYEVTLKVKVQAYAEDFDNAEEAQIIAEGLVLNAVEYGINVPEGHVIYDDIHPEPETVSVEKLFDLNVN